MGCQSSSQVERSLGIRINVLDSGFMKEQNQKIRQKMDKLDIKYQVYISLSVFIEDLSKIYANEIITTEELLKPLQKQLIKLNFRPNIYVISPTQNMSSQKAEDKTITYLKSYQQIIQQLTTKTFRKRRSTLNPIYQQNKQKIALKIFRKTQRKSSQQIIFQQTLKSKDISYEIYQSFSDLQNSMETKSANFIVTDYVYHREVLNLAEGIQTKVICFCQFNQDQIYDSRVYFVTNNFLEIVTEILSEQKLNHLNSVKCSKVYLYTNETNYTAQYAQIIENFDFQIKIYSDINKIIHQSKYFFALTILIDPDERKQVEKCLQKNNYSFKTKIVQIKKGTQNTVKGLRKILKQLKKGYRAQKGLTKSIDIIDKHFDNVKFLSIKQQLEKYEIICYGYDNLNCYIKNKKFISPFIICNYEQRSLLVRYLKQVQSKAQIILFCNKNHISAQLKQNKQFAFVSSHFGKILNFIKKHTVYNPYIIDENEFQIKEKKEKLKKNNKRISALKWSGQNDLNSQNSINGKSMNQLLKKFEFLNINSTATYSHVTQIQRQYSSLFQLDYLPLSKPQLFKRDLIESLQKLKDLLKICFRQQQFEKLLSQIQKMNTQALINKVKQFFSSKNQMGVKINKMLIDVQKMTKQQIKNLREFLFIVNLNFLSVYRDTFFGKIKLCHYLQSNLIQKCQIGSYILNKNYSIFYESDERCDKSQNQQDLTSYCIQVELESNNLGEPFPQYNSYFRFDNKFVFSPYSQFLIKQIRKTPTITIVSVQYKKNVDFLKYYFSQNILKDKNNILNVYEEQLQKAKNTENGSFLFDHINSQNFVKNMLRIKGIMNFQNGKLNEAIKLQKQVIIRQENIQNFDSSKQQWLNYQLACYYFKAQNHVQCRKILKQLLQAEPIQFLKEKVKSLDKFYTQRQKNCLQNNFQNQKQCEQTFRTIVLEPSMGHYGDQNIKELEQIQSNQSKEEQNIFDCIQIQNEFPCLDIEKIQDFERQSKQNIC